MALLHLSHRRSFVNKRLTRVCVSQNNASKNQTFYFICLYWATGQSYGGIDVLRGSIGIFGRDFGRPDGFTLCLHPASCFVALLIGWLRKRIVIFHATELENWVPGSVLGQILSAGWGPKSPASSSCLVIRTGWPQAASPCSVVM